MELHALAEEIRSLKADLAEDRRRPLVAAVAKAKGLTERQAKYLQGTSHDELARDADELLRLFGEAKEKLRPGTGADDQADDDDFDPQRVADDVRGVRHPFDAETEKVVDRVRRGY